MLEKFTRLQVFSVHLGLSLLVFSALAMAMVLHWFPGPFFASDGGWQGMRIIAAVDLVLGPSLTLIFYNPRKKKHRALLFDLSAIALVQLIALVWGTWTVYNQRTVAISFSQNQFFSISHGALVEANAALRKQNIEPRDIYELSDVHPRQVYVQPLQREELPRYLADIFNGLPEIQVRTDRFTRLAGHWDTVARQALEIDAFAADKPDLAAEIAALGAQVRQLEFYRLKLRFGAAVIAFDRDSHTLGHIFNYLRN